MQSQTWRLSRILFIQLILAIPLFFLFFLLQLCIIPCNAVIYGMIISIFNESIALLAKMLAQKIAQRSPKQGMALVFVFAGVRFIAIGVLFALGISFLAFDFLLMLLAFAILHIFSQILNLALR